MSLDNDDSTLPIYDYDFFLVDRKIGSFRPDSLTRQDNHGSVLLDHIFLNLLRLHSTPTTYQNRSNKKKCKKAKNIYQNASFMTFKLVII